MPSFYQKKTISGTIFIHGYILYYRGRENCLLRFLKYQHLVPLVNAHLVTAGKPLVTSYTMQHVTSLVVVHFKNVVLEIGVEYFM